MADEEEEEKSIERKEINDMGEFIIIYKDSQIQHVKKLIEKEITLYISMFQMSFYQ